MTRQRAKQIALEAIFRTWYERYLYGPYTIPYNGPVLSFTTDATVEVWRDIDQPLDFELISVGLVRKSVTPGANL